MITYAEVKELWDEVKDQQQIQGNPPITWRREDGEGGILSPGEEVKVEDGFSINVDSGYLS